MVISPDIPDAPFTMRGGIKCFELVAEQVKREILPGIFINGFGYNGSIPGPTILVHPGDWVSIRVVNKLPMPTSIHWHGLEIPNAMDGVPDVEPSPKIEPGQAFEYRFRVTNMPGTHLYYTHVMKPVQEMMGLAGGFIIVDPDRYRYHVNRDYFLLLQEFRLKGLKKGEVKQGTYELDPYSNDFNFFTINGRCYPYTSPLKVRKGENVRIRLGNVMLNAHPMHLHGHSFFIAATDGNAVPLANRIVKNTVPVSPGETCDLELLAGNPGKWPFHCHIPHHMSNNLTRGTGGMFTTIVYVD